MPMLYLFLLGQKLKRWRRDGQINNDEIRVNRYASVYLDRQEW